MMIRVRKVSLAAAALVLCWAAFAAPPQARAAGRCVLRNGLSYCCITPGRCQVCDSVHCSFIGNDPYCPPPCS
jgi:hypothetical protein